MPACARWTSCERGASASPAARELAGRLIDGRARVARPRRRAPSPAVTVVIPARDRAAQLDALPAVAWPAPRVVVVDDGSVAAEAVRAICERHRARLVRRSRSGGPGAARNAGLAAVDTELVAFLDSDCVAPPGWLERLGRHFADPNVGAVAPRVVPSRARSRPSAGRSASASATPRRARRSIWDARRATWARAARCVRPCRRARGAPRGARRRL